MKRPVRVRVESLKGTVALVVRVPGAMHRALMSEKEHTGQTLNFIVRAAVSAWFRRRGKP
jgi:hypothetical protein